MSWMMTATARRIDIPAPSRDSINIDDIAHHLANRCRFNGATEPFYSVAQHSVLVSELVPERDRLAALLHDAHEAYGGDVISPWKEYLNARFPGYAEIERMLQAQVLARFGILSLPSSVEIADHKALATERRDLLPPHAETWPVLNGIRPLRERIQPMTPAEARTAFLLAFVRYGGRP